MKRIAYFLGIIVISSQGNVQAKSAMQTHSTVLTEQKQAPLTNQVDDYVDVTHLFSGYRVKSGSVVVSTSKKTTRSAMQKAKTTMKRPLLSTASLYLDALNQILPLKDNPDYVLKALVSRSKRLTTIELRERLDLSLTTGKKERTGLSKTVLNKIRSAGLRLDYHFDTI